jgi:hypothetical protein
MTDEERTERSILQRKIKNQRRMLRLLNRAVLIQSMVIKREREGNSRMHQYWMRYAADLAEGHWFGGKRIAKTIRRMTMG